MMDKNLQKGLNLAEFLPQAVAEKQESETLPLKNRRLIGLVPLALKGKYGNGKR